MSYSFILELVFPLLKPDGSQETYVCSSSGPCVVLERLRDGYVVGSCSISYVSEFCSFSAHPLGMYIALGEKCLAPRVALDGTSTDTLYTGPPRVFILKVPSLETQCILTSTLQGAPGQISDLTFSSDGVSLAVASTCPDNHELALWNWLLPEPELALRSRFPDPIRFVRFADFQSQSSQLFTGSSGALVYWAAAKTFTGSKLQSVRGRFGRFEPITAPPVAELPDGRLITGGEDGQLLIWGRDALAHASLSPAVHKAEVVHTQLLLSNSLKKLLTDSAVRACVKASVMSESALSEWGVPDEQSASEAGPLLARQLVAMEAPESAAVMLSVSAEGMLALWPLQTLLETEAGAQHDEDDADQPSDGTPEIASEEKKRSVRTLSLSSCLEQVGVPGNCWLSQVWAQLRETDAFSVSVICRDRRGFTFQVDIEEQNRKLVSICTILGVEGTPALVAGPALYFTNGLTLGASSFSPPLLQDTSALDGGVSSCMTVVGTGSEQLVLSGLRSGVLTVYRDGCLVSALHLVRSPITALTAHALSDGWLVMTVSDDCIWYTHLSTDCVLKAVFHVELPSQNTAFAAQIAAVPGEQPIDAVVYSTEVTFVHRQFSLTCLDDFSHLSSELGTTETSSAGALSPLSFQAIDQENGGHAWLSHSPIRVPIIDLPAPQLAEIVDSLRQEWRENLEELRVARDEAAKIAMRNPRFDSNGNLITYEDPELDALPEPQWIEMPQSVCEAQLTTALATQQGVIAGVILSDITTLAPSGVNTASYESAHAAIQRCTMNLLPGQLLIDFLPQLQSIVPNYSRIVAQRRRWLESQLFTIDWADLLAGSPLRGRVLDTSQCPSDDHHCSRVVSLSLTRTGCTSDVTVVTEATDVLFTRLNEDTSVVTEAFYLSGTTSQPSVSDDSPYSRALLTYKGCQFRTQDTECDVFVRHVIPMPQSGPASATSAGLVPTAAEQYALDRAREADTVAATVKEQRSERIARLRQRMKQFNRANAELPESERVSTAQFIDSHTALLLRTQMQSLFERLSVKYARQYAESTLRLEQLRARIGASAIEGTDPLTVDQEALAVSAVTVPVTVAPLSEALVSADEYEFLLEAAKEQSVVTQTADQAAAPQEIAGSEEEQRDEGVPPSDSRARVLAWQRTRLRQQRRRERERLMAERPPSAGVLTVAEERVLQSLDPDHVDGLIEMRESAEGSDVDVQTLRRQLARLVLIRVQLSRAFNRQLAQLRQRRQRLVEFSLRVAHRLGMLSALLAAEGDCVDPDLLQFLAKAADAPRITGTIQEIIDLPRDGLTQSETRFVEALRQGTQSTDPMPLFCSGPRTDISGIRPQLQCQDIAQTIRRIVGEFDDLMLLFNSRRRQVLGRLSTIRFDICSMSLRCKYAAMFEHRDREIRTRTRELATLLQTQTRGLASLNEQLTAATNSVKTHTAAIAAIEEEAAEQFPPGLAPATVQRLQRFIRRKWHAEFDENGNPIGEEEEQDDDSTWSKEDSSVCSDWDCVEVVTVDRPNDVGISDWNRVVAARMKRAAEEQRRMTAQKAVTDIKSQISTLQREYDQTLQDQKLIQAEHSNQLTRKWRVIGATEEMHAILPRDFSLDAESDLILHQEESGTSCLAGMVCELQEASKAIGVVAQISDAGASLSVPAPTARPSNNPPCTIVSQSTRLSAAAQIVTGTVGASDDITSAARPLVLLQRQERDAELSVQALGHYAAQLRAMTGKLRHQHMRVRKSLDEIRANVNDLQERIDTLMQLKFGRKIDIEAVDKALLHEETDEVAHHADQLARERELEEAEVQGRIKELERVLLAETERETEQLVIATELKRTLRKTDGILSSAQRGMAVDMRDLGQCSVADRKNREELDRLAERVHHRDEQIACLTREINTLRSKGHHATLDYQIPQELR